MKIRKLSLTLAVAILLSFSISVSYASQDTGVKNLIFKDVPANHKNADAIKFLYNTGVIDGYKTKDNTKEFKPDNKINRAEFLKIILEGTGKANHKDYKSCFPDIKEKEWYVTYICQAKEEGIVKGYPDGKFKPGQTINEVEAIKILGETMDWQIEKPKENEAWYMPYLNFATTKNITEDKKADKVMTRGDIAEIIFRNDVIEEISKTTPIEKFEKVYIKNIFENNNIPFVGSGESKDTSTASNIEEKTSTTHIAKDKSNTIGRIDIVGVKKITVGDTTSIKIFLTDKKKQPLENRHVGITASTGIDSRTELSVTETGKGFYEGAFLPTSAGKYRLSVTDNDTRYTAKFDMKVSPGPFDHISIKDTIYPYQTDTPNKATLQVVSKDRYENVIPFGSENNLKAITDLGKVKVSHGKDNIFNVEVTADDWGVATITILNKDTVVDEGTSINFFPIQIGMPKGINSKDKQIKAPMYIFFPKSRGKLGSYDFKINTKNLNGLKFSNIIDGDTQDNINEPMYETGNGYIRVFEPESPPAARDKEVIPAGVLLLDVSSIGNGSIYVQDVTLRNENNEKQSYIGRFGKLVGDIFTTTTNTATDTAAFVWDKANAAKKAAEEKMVDLSEGFWIWWYNIKPSKDACIDVFVFPGDGVTAANVNANVAQANSIYAKIANKCNCNFFLNVIVNSITFLNATDWNAIDTNASGDLDVAELATMSANHPQAGKCRPVYYVPAITGGDLGWSYNKPAFTGNGVAVDHSTDADGRTLAHELAHQFSDDKIKDHNKPEGAAQGATDAGNLMNANNIGDDLTPKQCTELESHLP